ncbi:NTP transferase domain-containing protein [Gracilibacillus salitolerans]|uniref:NTP transferase domain-containing protein n=1 Tax=Gracilibacillus salitolerans TaxID=2663022 RepID=A0A5Q2TPV5_9BACI|nr:nucleotidyltransferase family protein [Gracilibacillus salitolerans]QGH36211.1 NTP transferase domain-containing protein [Gracilibacillus salitolerans]
MKCIILAAGYATRLYPLTKNKAKPLLEVAGKPILNHIIEKVEKVEQVDEVYIVTNEKFTPSFQDWAANYQCHKKIVVVNDRTTTNDDRLGAIADIQYVLDHHKIDEDIMVLAGDNLFDFELVDFVHFYQEVNADSITTHELDDPEEMKRTGIVEVNEDGVVTSFEEKPQEPKSNLAVPPFYLYKAETLPLFKQYLAEGNNPDAPGNFIPWLIQHKQVYAFTFEGLRYDIGTIDSYNKVQELF